MLTKRKKSISPKRSDDDKPKRSHVNGVIGKELKNKESNYSTKLNLILILLILIIVINIINFNNQKLRLDQFIENKDVNHLTSLENSLKPKAWIIGRNMEHGYLKHVIESFTTLGYSTVNGSVEKWDVLWSHDYPFSKGFFQKLEPYQKVNHFPGSGYITNKASLAVSTMKHIPKAFHLPKDKESFLKYAKNNPNYLWVKKSNDHRGIKLEKIEDMDLDSSGTFVQEYIQNPLLIDGKKFDVGLYVILTSINPLRLYIYDSDVLLRFCAKPYHPLNISDLDSYVVGDDYTPIWEMPSLKKYFVELNHNMKQTLNLYLMSLGKDPKPMWKKIEDSISKVYIEKEHLMQKSAQHSFTTTRHFFELVRFDYLIDEDLNVYLMEANMSPNLSSLHFAPNRLLYEQVIYNLFSLVGLLRLDGIHNWNILEKNNWNRRVSDKDLTSNNLICSSEECYLNCKNDMCKACLICLSDDMKLILKDAYLEHYSRWNTKRLLPKTHSEENPNGDLNKIQIAWFKGKCYQDSTWCDK